LAWARQNNVGLPTRLHDLAYVHEKFGLDRYELHLSFGEVDRLREFEIPEITGALNVHLPDYADASKLLDPFSSDREVMARSRQMLSEVQIFSERIYAQTAHTPVVVCSFSNSELSTDDFYEAVEVLFEEYSSSKVRFSLQWLPPIAWYFGGSVEINRVNSRVDALKISKLGVPITMDISHLLLGHNSGLYEAREIFRLLAPSTLHFHASGGSGVDGEGVDFDLEDPVQRDLLTTTLRQARKKNSSVILESWQGHLDDYAGFSSTLHELAIEAELKVD